MRFRRAVEALPHALTASRILLVGVAYTLVPDGPKPIFVGLVLLAVLTDMLDGPLARKLGVASERGANLDSIADFVLYVSLAVWAFLFEPAIFRPLLPLMAVILVLYVAALVLTKTRYGVVGLHNRWARLAGTFGVTYALWVVIWGWNVILATLLVGAVAADLWQRGRAVFGEPRRVERPQAG